MHLWSGSVWIFKVFKWNIALRYPVGIECSRLYRGMFYIHSEKVASSSQCFTFGALRTNCGQLDQRCNGEGSQTYKTVIGGSIHCREAPTRQGLNFLNTERISMKRKRRESSRQAAFICVICAGFQLVANSVIGSYWWRAPTVNLPILYRL